MSFIRFVDRLVDRHEKWYSEYHSDPAYYPTLLRYANTRDENARAWLAESMARVEYAQASRVWMFYTFLLLPVALFAPRFGWWGCGVFLVLAALIPLLIRFDRWNRRRKAFNALPRGEPEVYTKVEVKPLPEGSRIFQSYWTNGTTPQPLELDHPMEMMDVVTEANEWWQFRMPVPREDRGRIREGISYFDVGLVLREDNGRRRLLAGGVVYFSYDPWGDKLETNGYPSS